MIGMPHNCAGRWTDGFSTRFFAIPTGNLPLFVAIILMERKCAILIRCLAMKILVDDEVIGRLGAVREAVELRDGNGRTYGYFHPVAADKKAVPEGLCSPISDEELARRAASTGGRPLGEILQDLAKR
jgi:hypothetical protein